MLGTVFSVRSQCIYMGLCVAILLPVVPGVAWPCTLSTPLLPQHKAIYNSLQPLLSLWYQVDSSCASAAVHHISRSV